jgi:queuosine precursor transporter
MLNTDSKSTRLFIVLAGFFLTNALIAEFVGVKIFSLESTLGVAPYEWSLLGVSGNLNFTAGVLLWPFVFIMTDIINEYFGLRGVRLISSAMRSLPHMSPSHWRRLASGSTRTAGSASTTSSAPMR